MEVTKVHIGLLIFAINFAKGIYRDNSCYECKYYNMRIKFIV